MTKKILYYFSTILLLGLTACNPKFDFKKIVPENVDKFATGFIREVHNGNTDSCLTMILPEKQNEASRQIIENTYLNIKTFPIDSFSIINATKSTLLGDNGYTKYLVEYEYRINPRFLCFSFVIIDKNGTLSIAEFDGKIFETSYLDQFAFTFKGKGFLHYLFFFFAILVPIFILVTLIFAFRTELERKWLWIIGILFGFVKFSINWTTGQFMFNLITFSILGAGFSKSGNIQPWILSFSIPIVAIAFWIKRYLNKRKSAIELEDSNMTDETDNQQHDN